MRKVCEHFPRISASVERAVDIDDAAAGSSDQIRTSLDVDRKLWDRNSVDLLYFLFLLPEYRNACVKVIQSAVRPMGQQRCCWVFAVVFFLKCKPAAQWFDSPCGCGAIRICNFLGRNLGARRIEGGPFYAQIQEHFPLFRSLPVVKTV